MYPTTRRDLPRSVRHAVFFSNGARQRRRRITGNRPMTHRTTGAANHRATCRRRRRRRRLPLIPSPFVRPSVRRCRRRRPERIVTPAKNSPYGMKCGDHALIRGATPAGLGGTLGTRSKRAAGDPFVPGDDPDLTYGAELVKVRCALSLHLPLLCQWGRGTGSGGERERERGFYLITMRYVILLSSEQTNDAGRQAGH